MTEEQPEDKGDEKQNAENKLLVISDQRNVPPFPNVGTG